MMKYHVLQPLLSIATLCPLLCAGELEETEFTARDALTLLNAKSWSFSYAPSDPIRRLDVLVYEMRKEAGKEKTAVHHACMLGMLPRERVFTIKMLLVSNALHTSIDASYQSVKLSDDFIMGTFEYRKGGNAVKEKQGKRFMMEIGNEKEYKGKAPFKAELRFMIFENLNQATLKELLDGGQLPETANAEQPWEVNAEGADPCPLPPFERLAIRELTTALPKALTLLRRGVPSSGCQRSDAQEIECTTILQN